MTHVKWGVSRHIKAFAGLSVHSQKPIPKEWRWLLSRYYDVIESVHETDAYIRLEILRSTIRKLKGRKKKHLITAFKTLSSSLGKIIAHQRDPWMPTTNNLLEGQHTCYTYYPSFKRKMMTPKGAQRILDYRVFQHNFKRFPALEGHAFEAVPAKGTSKRCSKCGREGVRKGKNFKCNRGLQQHKSSVRAVCRLPRSSVSDPPRICRVSPDMSRFFLTVINL
ncbi:MAG: zinc ribbon domain-containing protein [Promethearchaeia archaeon]